MSRSTIFKPTIATVTERFESEQQSNGTDETDLDKFGPPVPEATAASAAIKRSGLPPQALIAGLVGVALVPTAILLLLLLHGAMRPRADGMMSPTGGLTPTGLAQPAQNFTVPEIALSSPYMLEAKAGQQLDFPIAIDATERLPSRSLIAISAMPDGASFSEGRPYGVTGWSLRPDEIGELRFRLPQARSGAFDLRIELLAGDGRVLAQSETRLNIAANPAEADTVSALNPRHTARVEAPNPVGLPPPPQPKPAHPAKTEPSVKVATVKVVTIKPLDSPRPHDGAFALSEAGEAPTEWMEVIRPVDMHARPEQSSETVKVVEKGLKLRVAARDKNWVQVSEPATSANGWIYFRFLRPTEPPSQ